MRFSGVASTEEDSFETDAPPPLDDFAVSADAEEDEVDASLETRSPGVVVFLPFVPVAIPTTDFPLALLLTSAFFDASPTPPFSSANVEFVRSTNFLLTLLGSSSSVR